MPAARASSWRCVLMLVAGVSECGVLLLASIALLTLPSVFDLYYPRLVQSPSVRDARFIDGWLHTNETKEQLNAGLKDGQLTWKELNHFGEVRKWLGRIPLTALVGAVVLVASCVALRERAALQRVQLVAAWTMLLLLVASVALAAWDWRMFFAWIHYPFFGPTNWRFPRGSYSLRLFPAAFWRAAGLLACAPPVILPLITAAVFRRSSARSQPASSSASTHGEAP